MECGTDQKFFPKCPLSWLSRVWCLHCWLSHSFSTSLSLSLSHFKEREESSASRGLPTQRPPWEVRERKRKRKKKITGEIGQSGAFEEKKFCLKNSDNGHGVPLGDGPEGYIWNMKEEVSDSRVIESFQTYILVNTLLKCLFLNKCSFFLSVYTGRTVLSVCRTCGQCRLLSFHLEPRLMNYMVESVGKSASCFTVGKLLLTEYIS